MIGHIKRILALVLCLALAAGLTVTAAAEAPAGSVFADITDTALAEAVETLRLMGVVTGGANGLFDPAGTFSRAQFAAMAVRLMGREREVAAYENRTIFPDVASTHWARGYINLALDTKIGDTPLVRGGADGRFHPDEPMTYGEAVTVILRILGYGAAADINWPYGACSLALDLGLDADLGEVDPNGAITRAQAALLFRNLLLAHPSGSTNKYISTLGDATGDTILVSLSATAPDGSAAYSFAGPDGPDTVKAGDLAPAAFLVGRRGTVLVDSTTRRFLTFLPDPGVTSRSFTVEKASASVITAVDGTKFSVPSAATVLRDGITSTYGQIYNGLDRPGLGITVYFTPGGSIDYIFVRGVSSVSGVAAVAAAGGVGAFDSITGSSRTCSVIRNGVAVSQSDIRQYDVGVYDAGTDTLYVTDFRLTGLYSAAEPNAAAPTSITFMGNKLELLSGALEGLAAVKVGSLITVAFSPDGKAAAVYGANAAGAPRSNALGIVTGGTSDSATVELLNAPSDAWSTVSGPLYGSTRPESLMGSVVSVTSETRRVGGETVAYLSLARQTGSAAGALNVAARTVGGVKLSDAALVFETVYRSSTAFSALARISLSDIPTATVPQDRILYVHTDTLGRVDILILNDVTGDRYTYGAISVDREQTDYFAGSPVINNVTTVKFGDGQDACVKVIGADDRLTRSGWGGACAASTSFGSVEDVKQNAGFAVLTAIEGMTQANFNASARTLTASGLVYPISDEVRCYNSLTGSWYSSLEECLLYSNSFTVYYDRTQSTGAKIRIIVSK